MSAAALEGRSPTQLALRRFSKNRRAMACFWVMLALGLSTVFVPMVSPHDFRTQKLEFQKKPPNGTYWMGTDPNGRDLFVRTFMGGRVSFAVGLLMREPKDERIIGWSSRPVPMARWNAPFLNGKSPRP